MSQRHILPLAELPPAQPKARGGNRPYRRGAAAERELLHSLRQDGLIAFRSAGSAGPFDVYALTPGGGRAMQVKRSRAEPPAWLLKRWWEALPIPPAGWSTELWVRGPCGWRSYRAPPEHDERETRNRRRDG